MLTLILILLLSYLAGSIPGSLWVGRWVYGVDLRAHGSGNPGATNAFRVLGWKAGLLATLLDMGKGVLAAGLIASLRLDVLPELLADRPLMVRSVAGFAAVIGHMYPALAGFRGGKGVNTAAGVLLAITPWNFVIAVATFSLVLWRTKYVSLSSMLAAASYPMSLLVMRYGLGWTHIGTPLIVFGGLLALGIVLAHTSNIKRLMRGAEHKIRWVSSPTVPGHIERGA
ncbi:MAG: glycerol-3-phosphate 1-O-acyltransferase PlsY [Rhodothermales bacterium]|nr:glycerol-3-phosphate 1-O-acyltransferase PlsY [Rhodothermales bacterium]